MWLDINIYYSSLKSDHSSGRTTIMQNKLKDRDCTQNHYSPNGLLYSTIPNNRCYIKCHLINCFKKPNMYLKKSLLLQFPILSLGLYTLYFIAKQLF